MTEIEQLKADLETLKNAREIAAPLDGGFSDVRFRTLIDALQEQINYLEAQQAPKDEWAGIRLEINAFAKSLAEDPTPPGHFTVKTPIMSALIGYIRHLEAELAKRPVSDAAEELVKELEQYKAQAKTADAANHEHYGRLQDQLAIRDLKIEKLESQLAAEKQFAQRMIEHAQATCVERDKFAQEVKALKQKPETTETLEFCSVCDYPLSACDNPEVDGIPRMDCKVCQLKDRLQEARIRIHTLEKPLDSNRVLETAVEIMTVLHVSNKAVLTAFQVWLKRYFKDYKVQPRPYAWIVSRK